MNKVNFSGYDRFPWSSDTFTFLQEMLYLSAKCSHLGGETYILSGCVENGLNVSSGTVVINGEILPFTGGAKQTKVYVKEARRDVNTQGYNFPEVYHSRSCEFGIGTEQYNWADFKRVETNTQLKKTIDDLKSTVDGLKGIPKGLISMWSGSVDEIPDGWALCTGQNGTPNLQGMFVAGYSTTDADYNEIGKKGGAKEVALASENNGPHTHGYSGLRYHDNSWVGGGKLTDGYTVYHENKTSASSGNGKPHENRPPYFVLAYIIKL